MKTLLVIKINILIIFFLFGCSNHFNDNELVMSDGMIIEAVRDNQILKIEAHKSTKRTFSIDTDSITVDLELRSERWKGSLGAYCASGNDKIHTVIEEGQQHFCSDVEAEDWLTWQNDRMQYIYTSDGLVIGWEFSRAKPSSLKTLNVQIWQFYVKDSKPNQLTNAQDDKIKIYFKRGYQSNLPPKGKLKCSSPKMIGKYVYSGKAIDLLQESGKKPSDIEKLIEYGEKIKKGNYYTYFAKGERFDAFNDLFWVILDKNGHIVLFD